MIGTFQKTNVEVPNPNILEVLRKRSKNRVTDAELSQVTLLSVAQPKMLPATVTPSQLFCLTRDPVTRIRVFSFCKLD